MSSEIKIPILLNYGGAAKASFEMSKDEFKAAAQLIRQRAREKAFSKGIPVYFSRKGKVYAEYNDGSCKIVSVK